MKRAYAPGDVDKELFHTWQAVPFLGHGNVANPLVVWVGSEVRSVSDVIEVFDAILLGHISAEQQQQH